MSHLDGHCIVHIGIDSICILRVAFVFLLESVTSHQTKNATPTAKIDDTSGRFICLAAAAKYISVGRWTWQGANGDAADLPKQLLGHLHDVNSVL